jgi:hypothetical protein
MIISKNSIMSSSPKCILCKHREKGLKCIAFPDKIPHEILSGNNNHSIPFPNQDNEVVFELIETRNP